MKLLGDKNGKNLLTRDMIKALKNGWYQCHITQKEYSGEVNGVAVHMPADKFMVQGVIAEITKRRLMGGYILRAWSGHMLPSGGTWTEVPVTDGPIKILFNVIDVNVNPDDGRVEINAQQNRLVDVRLVLSPYSETPPWSPAGSQPAENVIEVVAETDNEVEAAIETEHEINQTEEDTDKESENAPA